MQLFHGKCSDDLHPAVVTRSYASLAMHHGFEDSMSNAANHAFRQVKNKRDTQEGIGSTKSKFKHAAISSRCLDNAPQERVAVGALLPGGRSFQKVNTAREDLGRLGPNA